MVVEGRVAMEGFPEWILDVAMEGFPEWILDVSMEGFLDWTVSVGGFRGSWQQFGLEWGCWHIELVPILAVRVVVRLQFDSSTFKIEWGTGVYV